MEQYNNKLRLAQYRRTAEEIDNWDYRPGEPLTKSRQRLIGFDHYADVFLGLIPLTEYDDSGEFTFLADFPEIFPDMLPHQQKTSAAVLFTGGVGCGKHTADYMFMRTLFDFVKDELTEAKREDGDYSLIDLSEVDFAVEFYQITMPVYDTFSERQLGENMDRIFEQIYDKAVSQPSLMFYFSLGDVTRYLESKRLVMRFVEKVQRLTADTRSRCILTAIYQGEASALRPEVKKPFYVLALDPPDEDARREYFEYLTESYRNIRFGMSAGELTEQTKGFSFGEIKQLAGYLLMAAKAAATRERQEISSIRLEVLPERSLIQLDKKTALTYIGMIQNARYVPQAAVPVYAAPGMAQTPVQAPSVHAAAAQTAQETTADAPKPPSDGEKKDYEQTAKEMADNADRPSRINEMFDQLPVPSKFEVTIVMYHQTFYSSAFSKHSSGLDDFLALCSKEGLTNLSNLKSVTVTLGGNLELHPHDNKLMAPSEKNSIDYQIVIREGRIIESEIRRIGKDAAWLENQLKKRNCRAISEVFLGACDENGELMIFRVAN